MSENCSMFDAETKRVCLEQIRTASANFGERNPVIWGTHEKGAFIKELLEELGYSCSFFVSSRPKTDTYCGVPLRTPEILDVNKHYVFLATSSSEVKEYLHSHGFSETDEQDCLEVGYFYYSCAFLEKICLNGGNWIADTENKLLYCCLDMPNPPSVSYSISDAPQEIMERFLDYRDRWINESRKFDSDRSEEGRVLTTPCIGCSCYQKKNWLLERGIYVVNLSVYPAPCQSKCFYCDVHLKGHTRYHDTTEERNGYEAFWGILEYAKNKGMFRENVQWLVTSGEITIHPYRERILNLIGSDTARFFTNGMKYDEQIAQKLSENPKSDIFISVDSGTAETWHRVKGVDNFDTVKKNLFRYHAKCLSPDQIALKYIIFPGVNDFDADFCGIIELMKQLHITKLNVSCEIRQDHREKSRADIVRSAMRLFALCEKNGICPFVDEGVWQYTPEEYEEIRQGAKALLTDGAI
ncbi:MAG: radical SAM protein [Oscillospiraceae bacterium]|nr:radical SAM protein [Oscillospiraceae bacterium]